MVGHGVISMPTLRLGNQVLSDVNAAMRAFPDEAFGSQNRSTIPLLDYWRDAGRALGRVSTLAGLSLSPEAELTFEYQVPVRRGRGKASHTDLMIVSPTDVVAVEAKYLEPPYEDVRTWLGEPRQPNREEVLKGWLECIAGATGRTLTVEQVLAIPYQLVHRTASACSIERPRRTVLYQLFCPDHVAYYEAALHAFQRVLPRSEALRFAILVCPVVPTVAHSASCTAALRADAIRAALLEGPFFGFREETLLSV
jgi:hypothetical protein